MKPFHSRIAIAIALSFSPHAYAGSVAGLTHFNAGTPAKAAEVNANFVAVKTAVDDNNSRVATLEAEVASLKTQLAAVLALSPHLTVTAVAGGSKVVLSGVNLQVVNGAGKTDSVNGLGNIIIGYDKARSNTGGTSLPYVCSDGNNGLNLDWSTCTAAGATWALSHKSGSHYLVIGDDHSYSQYGGLLAGWGNSSNEAGASVTGGFANIASGQYASVSGGANNHAAYTAASVIGGKYNTADNYAASISGGQYNKASGASSSVSGGDHNIASANSSSVSGGGNGTAAGGNTADWNYGSILGGVGQSTSSASQTIPALP